jgi:hypothetical protein
MSRSDHYTGGLHVLIGIRQLFGDSTILIDPGDKIRENVGKATFWGPA